jgi:hypothetical protein
VCVWRRLPVSKRMPARLHPSRREVTSTSQNPPLFEEDASLVNMYMCMREQKILVKDADETVNQELLFWREPPAF